MQHTHCHSHSRDAGGLTKYEILVNLINGEVNSLKTELEIYKKETDFVKVDCLKKGISHLEYILKKSGE